MSTMASTITTAQPREIKPYINPEHKSKIGELTVVLVESPLSPSNGQPFKRNIYYAQECMRYVMKCGGVAITTHLEWTQYPGATYPFIPDEQTDLSSIGRENALVAGDKIRTLVEEVWVFTDLGISSGMQRGIDHAHQIGKPVREMHLPEETLEKVKAWQELE